MKYSFSQEIINPDKGKTMIFVQEAVIYCVSLFVYLLVKQISPRSKYGMLLNILRFTDLNFKYNTCKIQELN